MKKKIKGLVDLNHPRYMLKDEFLSIVSKGAKVE